MTIAKKTRSKCFAELSMLGVLAATVGGCDSERLRHDTQSLDTGGIAGAPGLGADVASTDDEIPAGYVEDPDPPSDEGLCGTAVEHTDEDGVQHVSEERYYYDRMNVKLDTYAELREAIGLTSVSDCDSARAFVRGYNAYRAAHPEFKEIRLPDEEPFAAALRPVSASSNSVDDTEVNKILSGAATSDNATVGIQSALQLTVKIGGVVQKEPTIKRGATCSGVKLSGPFILTSAHCVPRVSDGYEKREFPIFIRSVAAAPGDKPGFFQVYRALLGKYVPRTFNSVSKQYGKYVGTGDYRNDLGIIFIKEEEQKYMKMTPANEAAFLYGALIATRTPKKNDVQKLITWGPTTLELQDGGGSKWTQNIVKNLKIDDAQPGFWTIPSSQVQLCQGDSGGGAYRDGLLDGIASTIIGGTGLPLFSGCAAADATQYWTSLNSLDIHNWIVTFTYTVQNMKNGAYYCEFVEEPGDPKFDYEKPTAYVTCISYWSL